MSWLENLKDYAERHPIVVIRFSDAEWEELVNSRRGVNEFTIARSHATVDHVKVPSPCLVFGTSGGTEQICFGLLSSKSPITTLDTRIKVSRFVTITLCSATSMAALVTGAPHAKNVSARVQSADPVTLLSSKLSSYLIERLATSETNKGGMRAVAESLSVPRRFKGNIALQEDAVQTALTAFGLTASDQALEVELVEGKATALGRAAIMEDLVVEHDARTVPDYSLIESDVTGRALFQKGEEQLEVFTAKRRDLEHCFGVDVIYVNVTKQNVVMLQYKMLQPERKVDDVTDWVYRPDSQLDAEITRMKVFAAAHVPGARECRLNPQMFYVKCVKRDAELGGGGMIMFLDHCEKVRADKSFKGPKNGLRVSRKTLNGSYVRQTPFLDLVKCGYIGAHAQTSTELRLLIKAVRDENMAVVAAVQQRIAE